MGTDKRKRKTPYHAVRGAALRRRLLDGLERLYFDSADTNLHGGRGSWRKRDQCQPGSVEIYTDPLPLVAEIWSQSTGNYDVTEKLAAYQRRGDLEIWRIHPYDRTLTAWRRQDDGAYTETLYRGGSVRPAFLPDVSIDLDTLFTRLRGRDG